MSSQVKRNMQQYYAWPNKNLSSYLARQRAGNMGAEVVMTPFARGESVDETLTAWNTQLESVRELWPTLYDWEMEMRSKVGPMSCMKPLKERMDSIEAYYNLPNNPEPLSSAAFAQCVRRWLQVGHLKRRGRQATIDAMKLSTNSGCPFFTKRRLVVEQEFNATVHPTSKEWLVDYPDDRTFSMCATLGWRGQEGGPKPEDTKQRVLWMFPMQVNIAELSFYQPLIRAAQAKNLVPAWNGDLAVDEVATRLLHTKGVNDLVVCTDFTSFDQHFNTACQNDALDVLEQIFNHDEDVWSVLAFKYTIPLCLDVGVFTVGRHGMASGSGGTNADETIFHSGLQIESALLNNTTLNPASMCLGDDGVLTFPGITPEKVMETYTRHGLEMNLSKQYASKEDMIYLRRWHHRDYMVGNICVGVYSTMRALGRLRYMERFIDPDKWGVKAVAMRELSVIENCRYHPLFPEFVEFCVKRDKFRLGLDISGFLDNIDAIYQEAKANDTLYVSYSQEFNNPTPPAKWAVVNILKKMK